MGSAGRRRLRVHHQAHAVRRHVPPRAAHVRDAGCVGGPTRAWPRSRTSWPTTRAHGRQAAVEVVYSSTLTAPPTANTTSAPLSRRDRRRGNWCHSPAAEPGSRKKPELKHGASANGRRRRQAQPTFCRAASPPFPPLPPLTWGPAVPVGTGLRRARHARGRDPPFQRPAPAVFGVTPRGRRAASVKTLLGGRPCRTRVNRCRVSSRTLAAPIGPVLNRVP